MRWFLREGMVAGNVSFGRSATAFVAIASTQALIVLAPLNGRAFELEYQNECYEVTNTSTAFGSFANGKEQPWWSSKDLASSFAAAGAEVGQVDNLLFAYRERGDFAYASVFSRGRIFEAAAHVNVQYDYGVATKSKCSDLGDKPSEEIIGDGSLNVGVPIAISRSPDNMIRLALNILPRNPIATGGKSLQEYQNDLVDTLFERMPLRRFHVAVSSSDADQSVISVDDVDYQEDSSLAGQYLEKDGLSAWVKGFGGSTSAFKYIESAYGEFGNWKSTHGGTALGVDYALSDDFKFGVYGNWGNVNVTYLGLAGGDWSPNGWGGGLTATYAKENFYAQGLFGATGFSGTHNRYLLSVGSFGGGNAFSTKRTTSYVGALRVGSPQQ